MYTFYNGIKILSANMQNLEFNKKKEINTLIN